MSEMFTLAEARRKIAQDLCSVLSHDARIVWQGGAPSAVVCQRCGKHWRLEEADV